MKQFIAAEFDLRDDSIGSGTFEEGARAVVSRQALEAVIGRAILDEEFRWGLFAEPEAALVEYELTERELAALKSVDAESLDACANGLGRRVVSKLARAVPGGGTLQWHFAVGGVTSRDFPRSKGHSVVKEP